MLYKWKNKNKNPTGNFLGYPEMNPLNPLSQNFPDSFDHAMSEISHRLTNATCCQLISCHLDVLISLLTVAGYVPNLFINTHSHREHSERTSKGDNTASICSSIKETLIFFFFLAFYFVLDSVCAQLLQRVQLCDSMDCSLPGSFVCRILLARILE